MITMEKKKQTLSDYPDIMLDWAQDLNNELDPNKISYSSHIMATWKCHKCGRIWKSTIKSRTTSNTGCTCDAMERKSASLRKTLVKKLGSLRDHYPELASLWNYEKNGIYTPDNLTCGSEYEAWWIDNKGYEWRSKVLCMTRSKGRTSKLIVGKNDFATLRPELAEQWNYEKNNKKRPCDYHAYAKDKVWWICYKGHEWEASLSSRTAGRGCPECNKEKGTSFPEQAIFYYLKQLFSSAENRYRIGRSEIDIYIPDLRVGIEFDGSFYHNTQRKRASDERKNRFCKDHGIFLVRLIETGCMEPPETAKSIYYLSPLTEKNLEQLISELVTYLSEKYSTENVLDISLFRDEIRIREQYISYEKEHSIASVCPELISEWDTDKNGKIKPEYITVGSSVKYWWKCQKCGHSWKAAPYFRTHSQGCPCCSGHVVVKGINDLSTVKPELVQEWDWESNEKTPFEVAAMSSYRAHWICKKCGHHWQTTVANRSKGTGCSRCAGKILTKEKSLLFINPKVAKQWDYEKNYPLTPEEVFANSSESAYWICEKGHSWKAIIGSRAKENGNGCPYCSNILLLAGYNDLATLRPQLLEEWDYEKNNCKPNEVFPKANIKIYWKCRKGHSYLYNLASKTSGKGCPYCDGKKPVVGKNDLATTHPQLIKEWDYKKNGDLSPISIKAGSNKAVNWICSKCGYRWTARIFTRAKGQGCPRCAGKVPFVGKNDLATTHPELSMQWDYEKNGSKTPQTISHGSRYNAFWKCPICGYSWQAPVCSRTNGRHSHSCKSDS